VPSERTWDHEDCPRDDCEGELEQQDKFNVMCLSCEDVFSHYRRGSFHWLEDSDFETVAKKKLVTDGGEVDPSEPWFVAGLPDPVAAECVSEGTCQYRDCLSDADYRVEWSNGDQRTTSLICDDCSQDNKVWVRENDLLDAEGVLLGGGGRE
jgi:hypothetical protein